MRHQAMMQGIVRVFLAATILILLTGIHAFGQTRAQVRALSEGAGNRLFGDNCLNCHGNPEVRGAPSPAVLKELSPERIYQALTTGAMKTNAAHLTDQQKIDIAQWVGGRRMGATESGDVKTMSNRCSSNPPFAVSANANWNGWGADLTNRRFQTAEGADLSTGQVSRLKLKWAFGLPGAITVDGQPSIVGGRVFVSSDTGWVYSLDANTGCVYWGFQSKAAVRSATSVGPVTPGSTKYGVYFGDIRGNTYGVDATTGELLWTVMIDEQPLARITGGTKYHNGRVYVPVASMEEPEAGSVNYKCCTFRGMVVALDSQTGKQIWKTHTIQEIPSERKTAKGVKHWGPSGADVWNSPTIDVKRNAIYFGTGNNFSDPATDTSDAVMALDLNTGKILWWVQLLDKDVWHTGCTTKSFGTPPGEDAHASPEYRPQQRPATYYCPEPQPDWDVSSSPMLTTLADGRTIVVVSPKSGIVFAHDVDKKGAIIWKNDVARIVPGSGGEILFGGATDGENGYFNLKSGGIVAVRLKDGVEQWYKPLPPQSSMADFKGLPAAVTAIPGVVFSPALDGMVRAFSSSSGALIWEFNTVQEFTTVNGIKGKGGSLGSAGVTVANGMVFIPSGYTGWQGGAPGNVLLAFAPYDRVPE